MQSSSAASTEDLRDQIRILGDDVKELARLTRNVIGRRVHDAKDGAGAIYERGADKAAEYRDQLAGAAREHPLRSVLIAAGIGAVLGLFVGRR